ncbi:recQ-mediated genome instability protein 1 isoform X2 [Bombina bombina]|nr:recQ-mediated genome instability protein 1 isoform X2 [Bombina bombina]
MNSSDIANRVKTWLSSARHVKVPDQWLEACINWIQEENESSSLSQAEINKQVFDQWLLTDLRDLEFPVLPQGILESLKFELNGFYALQMDSLVDVSLPAYSQLQKLRGRDNPNEQVTATTQATQKPWEAKPNRMLMLQLTDGTQQIQGMEYQPIPILNTTLPPGAKLLLQGTVTVRLGVLLLKPENVKFLGGEVEALLEEHSQVQVLSRLIGAEVSRLPQRSDTQEQDVASRADDIGQVVGPSDEDLLASLDDNLEFTINNGTVRDSGYYSRNDSSSHSSNISYLDRQQTQELRAGQDYLPLPNQNVRVNIRDPVVQDYDIDDDIFLEEEIQRELEETSMSQAETTHRNKDLPTAISSTLNRHTFDNDVSRDNLDNPPFTYLSVIFSSKISAIKSVKLKSFIVTLNGNLTSCTGFWSIKAKISDGTGYLDVEFSDTVLTKLIGFSVPEMKKLKKDPTQKTKLMNGLQKCQQELTDFCGIMTISYNPTNSEASVVALENVNEETMESLRIRVNR